MTVAPMRVFVYRNVHRNTYSVKAMEGPDKGKVIHRSDHVLIAFPSAKVSEAGRQRVLREHRKNVHAGIVGELVSLEPQDFTGPKLKYNPYRYDTFVHESNEAPFQGANTAYLSPDGVRIA
jgi:hypothetical protein